MFMPVSFRLASRRNRAWPALWALALCVAFPEASPAALAQVIQVTQARSVVSDAPLFPVGEPAETVSLPDDWHLTRPKQDASVWYRVDLARRSKPAEPDTPMALFIERACSNVEVHLNGQRLHFEEDWPASGSRSCHYPQLIHLPSGLWRDQDNVLDLRVRGHALQRVASVRRAAGLSALEIGPRAMLVDTHAWLLFWNVTSVQIACAALATMGCVLLLLGWRSRRETPLSLLGALMLAWSLTSLRIWLRDTGLENAVVEFIASALFAPVTALAVTFLLRAVHLRSRPLEAGLLAQCAVMPLSMLMAGPNRLYAMSLAWHSLLAFEVLAAIGLHLWAAWRQRTPGLPWLSLILVGLAMLLLEPVTRLAGLAPLPIDPLQLGVSVLLLAWGTHLLLGLSRAERAALVERQRLERRIEQLIDDGDRRLAELATLRFERQKVQERKRSTSEPPEGIEEAARSAALLAEARLERVTAQERKRIAADLHDDLGAKLLTIVHTSDNDQIATLARDALEEMRLSVRGLTGKPMRLADAVADWRSETVARLSQANIEVDWRGLQEDTSQALAARSFVQTTRILREAISNVIKHSGASQCKVRCGIREGEFGLVVQDNGKGISLELDGKLDRGHGMASMKNRAKQMQGQCLVESGPGYGTVIRLTIPL
jgi:two-component system sensor histidine kinase UhpB